MHKAQNKRAKTKPEEKNKLRKNVIDMTKIKIMDNKKTTLKRTVKINGYNEFTLMDEMKRRLCTCGIFISDENIWTITSWYAEKDEKHKGYGKTALHDSLAYLYETEPEPSEIEYLWDGNNQHVIKWIKEQLGASQKQSETGRHEVYTLDKEKTINYIKGR